MKKFLSILAMAVVVSTPAHAISAKYRAQLERSGCNMTNESQGCDIHKTKAENEAAGFHDRVAPASPAVINKFNGDYVARHKNGQRVANIHVSAGKVTIGGMHPKATVMDDMLIINGSKTLTYVIYTNGKSYWEDTDSHNRGAIERVSHD